MPNVQPRLATLPTRILKRDGTQVAFAASKIRSAIERAGRASGEFGAQEAERLTSQVIKVLSHRFHNGRVPDIEAIQDLVEQTLIADDHFATARAYIRYREQHRKLRSDRRTLVDAAASIDEYLDRSDWRISANANQGWSLGGLILNTSGKMIANYWLSHVYPPEIGEAHRAGDIHIHDLDMLAGYCAGWSLRTLLHEGLNGVPGKVESGPPRHLSSAIGQIVNFLGTLQNEWAGAQAFSSFDTYMAPYVRKDLLEYAQVRQYIQELIYNLNVPSRWGCQTPFTNLTFDWICPEDLREQIPIIAGEEQPFAYGDLQREMDLINRAYIEVMTAGDAKGRIFTFPIPTYNMTEDFPWDSENAQHLFAMTAKYGLPYFQNFINSELRPNMVRSMCCRLQLDLRELLKRGNGLFGSAEQTGSLGVVTLNCARLAMPMPATRPASWPAWTSCLIWPATAWR
jgi:anaerobic ribonucleoside-triphosphate reductase